jgi:hypothetical protein
VRLGLIIAVVLMVTGRPGTRGDGPAVAPAVVLITQLPPDAPIPAADDELPAGARIVAVDRTAPGRPPTVLTPDFDAAGRPDVSFDGTRVLFVGRRAPGDPFACWQMRPDGSDVRRVTDLNGCLQAVHVSVIYTIDAAEPARQIAICARGDDGVPSLHTCRADGSRLRRITFTPYGATDPFQLSDGRLLFATGRPDGRPDPSRGTTLHTVNSDGTDVFVFTGDHGPAVARGMACEMSDGRVVLVERDAARAGGTLVAVERTASLHTRTVVAGERGGGYREPSLLDDRRLMVAHRPPGGGSWGIHELDPALGRPGRIVHDSPDWHEIDAILLAPRREPAGRSSVVDERRTTGALYCLDTSLSDDGAGTAAAERLQVFTVAAGNGAARPSHGVPERLIGEVPLEPDGSFHLEVPAATPLRLQTLDGGGTVVRAMRSWLWVMPREARGCIGCHEDRELAPPNRHVLALRKPPHVIALPETRAAGAAAASEGDPP